MSKIVFIVQQLSQPRCIKRIQYFKNSGYDCLVFGFNNGLYTENLKNVGFDVKEEWFIDKSFIKPKKINIYKKNINHVISQINNDDIIYAFGFEIGTLVSFLWKYKFIYEEADVSAARIKNTFIRFFFVYLDKRIIRKSILTIFTSEGFQEYLFGNVNPYSYKTLFIHNKLHDSFIDKERPIGVEFNDKNIKFGFIGLIRYPNTIVRFANIVGSNFPQHEFHFFGEVEGDSLNQINWTIFPNVKFHGKFKNPQDLNSIYCKIDINVVCYDPTSGNVRIAEPNKLYESIFFNKPLIVSQGTFLQKRVEDLQVGYAINALSDSAIINFIQSITSNNIYILQNNCSLVNSDQLINNASLEMNKIKAYLIK